MKMKKSFPGVILILLAVAVLTAACNTEGKEKVANDVKVEVPAGKADPYDIYEADHGTYYSYERICDNKKWDLIIYMPVEGDSFYFDARAQAEDKIYSLALDKIDVKKTAKANFLKEAEKYIALGFANLDQAKVSKVSDFVTNLEEDEHQGEYLRPPLASNPLVKP
ncbi:MAG: hypothetical protein GX314_05565 [Clostridiaceae bacterium]|nr:hypothetical protein [Clostridiaceae bacterium]